jgi:hypothetical protein
VPSSSHSATAPVRAYAPLVDATSGCRGVGLKPLSVAPPQPYSSIFQRPLEKSYAEKVAGLRGKKLDRHEMVKGMSAKFRKTSTYEPSMTKVELPPHDAAAPLELTTQGIEFEVVPPAPRLVCVETNPGPDSPAKTLLQLLAEMESSSSSNSDQTLGITDIAVVRLKIDELQLKIDAIEREIDEVKKDGAKWNDPRLVGMRAEMTGLIVQQTELQKKKNLLLKAQLQSGTSCNTPSAAFVHGHQRLSRLRVCARAHSYRLSLTLSLFFLLQSMRRCP